MHDREPIADIGKISDGLKQDADGIWRAPSSPNVSYPVGASEICFAVEDDSFWFKHRNACIASLVNSFPPAEGMPIFDIGGGNGFVAQGLTQAGYAAVLVEPGRNAAVRARERGLETVVCGTLDTCGFKSESFQAAGLFDVIEHIEDDRDFLTSVRNKTKRGGMLYLTVPGHSLLWSEEDVQAGHYRRYSMSQLSTLLASSGYCLEFSSHFFSFLPLPIFLMRTLPSLLKPQRKNKKQLKARASDHSAGSGVFVKPLDMICSYELKRLGRLESLCFGSSIIAAAKAV